MPFFTFGTWADPPRQVGFGGLLAPVLPDSWRGIEHGFVLVLDGMAYGMQCMSIYRQIG